MLLEKLDNIIEKNEWHPTSNAKINMKWVTVLNIKDKMIKLIENNKEENLQT